MSYSSQVLDHSRRLPNSLRFNVFALVAGVEEEESSACIGRFVQICSRWLPWKVTAEVEGKRLAGLSYGLF